jgi:NADH-quinone oxidoreductase subunit L
MEAEFLHIDHFFQHWSLALIPLLPLAGFLANGLGWVLARDKWPRAIVNAIAVGTVAGSLAVSFYWFFFLRSQPHPTYLTYTLFEWINVGSVQAPFSLVFDRLSAVMCLIVTGVGGLIHLYSTGYMAHDKAFARYFAYLNLFTFAMLLLVMGKNIVLMFVGWEGVGLCSYLLIGFWYEDDAKASAGKKAFIVNRIGDFGFLVGIFTILGVTARLGGPTLDFYEMAERLSQHSSAFAGMKILGISTATFIGLSLFVGATGKSAQIPLYVWLPDAMAGPTPVSALIHAATMVTAGVYMIGRLNFIYVFSPTALMVVAAVGVGTALFSATIGFTQNDIKKVLAYSTVSQLGFMFTAMGVGAFASGIFHLTTHAFFKALLFLGAGSVIHGLSGEQDLKRMGGLSKLMPITCWTMVAGWLAISGFPLLSGFVSKDEILWQAFANPLHPVIFNRVVYLVGLITAGCTAIYMTRLMMLAFFTESRMDHDTQHHVHESPWNMTSVLIILAILSVAGGLLNWPKLLSGDAAFEHWLEPMWATMKHPRPEPHHYSHALEYGLMGLSVAVGLAAIIAVGFLYKKRMDKTADIAAGLGPLYRASFNKYWVDEIYDYTVVEPAKRISYFLLFKIFDAALIDGAVNGVGRAAKWLGERGKLLHSGVAGTYALWIILGLLAMLAYFWGLR